MITPNYNRLFKGKNPAEKTTVFFRNILKQFEKNYAKMQEIDQQLQKKVTGKKQKELTRLKLIEKKYSGYKLNTPIHFIDLNSHKLDQDESKFMAGLIEQLLEQDDSLAQEHKHRLLPYTVYPLYPIAADGKPDTKQAPERFIVLSHELLQRRAKLKPKEYRYDVVEPVLYEKSFINKSDYEEIQNQKVSKKTQRKKQVYTVMKDTPNGHISLLNTNKNNSENKPAEFEIHTTSKDKVIIKCKETLFEMIIQASSRTLKITTNPESLTPITMQKNQKKKYIKSERRAGKQSINRANIEQRLNDAAEVPTEEAVSIPVQPSESTLESAPQSMEESEGSPSTSSAKTSNDAAIPDEDKKSSSKYGDVGTREAIHYKERQGDARESIPIYTTRVTMQYHQGKNLSKVIEDPKIELHYSEKILLAMQIIDEYKSWKERLGKNLNLKKFFGLNPAQTLEVIHGDIKANNIMHDINSDMTAVVDFGISDVNNKIRDILGTSESNPNFKGCTLYEEFEALVKNGLQTAPPHDKIDLAALEKLELIKKKYPTIIIMEVDGHDLDPQTILDITKFEESIKLLDETYNAVFESSKMRESRYDILTTLHSELKDSQLIEKLYEDIDIVYSYLDNNRNTFRPKLKPETQTALTTFLESAKPFYIWKTKRKQLTQAMREIKTEIKANTRHITGTPAQEHSEFADSTISSENLIDESGVAPPITVLAIGRLKKAISEINRLSCNMNVAIQLPQDSSTFIKRCFTHAASPKEKLSPNNDAYGIVRITRDLLTEEEWTDMGKDGSDKNPEDLGANLQGTLSEAIQYKLAKPINLDSLQKILCQNSLALLRNDIEKFKEIITKDYSTNLQSRENALIKKSKGNITHQYKHNKGKNYANILTGLNEAKDKLHALKEEINLDLLDKVSTQDYVKHTKEILERYYKTHKDICDTVTKTDNTSHMSKHRGVRIVLWKMIRPPTLLLGRFEKLNKYNWVKYGPKFIRPDSFTSLIKLHGLVANKIKKDAFLDNKNRDLLLTSLTYTRRKSM